MRGLALSGMIAFVVLAPAASAGAATPDEAVKRLASGKVVEEEEREALIAALVEANAASRIAEHMGAERVPVGGAEPLVEALKRMNTDEAVAALRGLTFSSRFASSDVANWARLCRKLSGGAGESGPPAMRYIWRKLSLGVRKALGPEGSAEELTEAMKGRALRALNAVLGAKDFYRICNTGVMALNEEAKELLERHDKFYEFIPGTSLDRIQLERLNRHLMDAVLEGSVRPLAAVELRYYQAGVANLAFTALAGLESPSATEIVLTTQPAPVRAKLAQIKAAEKIPSFDATALISEYLLAKNSTTFVNARKALLRRFEEDPTDAVDVMTDLIMRIGYVFEEDVPDENAAAVVAVCVALAEEDARAVLGVCLRTPYEGLRKAVLAALAEKPPLADSPEMLDALFRLAQEHDDDVDLAKAILAVIKAGRIAGGLEIAAYYLDHEDPEVRGLAAKVLRRVSGKNIRTAERWRAALDSNPDLLDTLALEEEAERVTRRAPAAAPEEEESSFSAYVFVLLGLVAIFLVIYLTRSPGGKIK